MTTTNHCTPLGAIASCGHCYCKAAAKCCDAAACPQNARKVCCKCGAEQAQLSGYSPTYPRVWPSYPYWGTSDPVPLTGTATWQIPPSSHLGGFTCAASQKGVLSQ